MTASHAALASMNAPLAQSLKAKSTQLIPTYVLIVALALTFAPLALSLRANKFIGLQPNKLNSLELPLPAGGSSSFCVSSFHIRRKWRSIQ